MRLSAGFKEETACFIKLSGKGNTHTHKYTNAIVPLHIKWP